MKSYTNLEQSQKLAEMLPTESADMVLLHEEPYETSDSKFDGLHQALCVPFSKYNKSWRQKYRNISYFPCWSLAALLEIIRKPTALDLLIDGRGYRCHCRDKQEGKFYGTDDYCDTPIDACIEVILKLHEQKLL